MAEGHGKGGLFAGIVAAVGLGGLRFADDCGRAGARVASHADDLGRAGGRGFGAVDEVRGAHSGVFDEFADGARAGKGARGELTALEAAASRPKVELEWSDAADFAEYGIELGSQYGSDFDAVSLADARLPGEVARHTACPTPIDLERTPEQWRRMIDEGFGAACAPRLVHGIAQTSPAGEPSIRVGSEAQALARLASECRAAGTTCVFVGCSGSCSPEGIDALLGRTRPIQPEISAHATALVASALEDRFGAYAFVALTSALGPPSLGLFRPARHGAP